MSSFGRGSLAIKAAEQGSGLGLLIVKGLVDLHGGGFRLKSKPREGTEVIVTFPAARVMNALPAGSKCPLRKGLRFMRLKLSSDGGDLARHPGLLEGRHVAMAGRCGLNKAHSERCARPLAEPHAEIQERCFVESFKHLTVRPLRRHVPGNAVVERARVERVQDCSGGRRT